MPVLRGYFSKKVRVYNFSSSLKFRIISFLMMLACIVFSQQFVNAAVDNSEANKQKGFPSNSIFENYGDENINILNGDLALLHPISPLYPVNGSFSYQLQRIYSSKI